MSAKVWSGVAIAVQSALATALVVTGITKANPAVVSYTGTDPTNGDYELIKAQGMSQMDYRIVRVANENGVGNTFEADGVDASAFDTFSSGTAEGITFGTTLNVVSGITVSGGDFNMIDVTTIHDLINKQIPGNANAMVISMECLWDPADTGLIALKTASDTKAIKCVKVTFSDSTKVLFAGYVGCTLAPTGSAQGKVTTPVTFTVYGRITTYTT